MKRTKFLVLRSIWSLFPVLFSTVVLFGRPDSIDSLYKKTQKNTPQEWGESQIRKAEKFFYMHPDSSVFFAKKALDAAREQGNARLEASSLETIGFAEGAMGLHSQGLDHVMQALSMYEQLKDPRGIASASNYLGNLYIGLGQVERSNFYFRASLQYYTSVNDLPSIARQMGNIGILKRRAGEFDSAQYYIGRSIAIRKALHDSIAVAEMGVYLARAFVGAGKQDSAAVILHESIKMMRKHSGSVKFLAIALTELSKIELQNGRIEPALKYILEAKDLASVHKLSGELSETHKNHALILNQKGLYREAFQSFLAYSQMRDSLLSGESRQKIADLQLAFERRREEELIERLKNENRLEAQNRRLWSIAAAASLLILFLLGLGYRQRAKAEFRQKRVNSRLLKLNHDLTEQRNLAEAATRTKSFLMEIAVHDLKNPLQSIMGLSQLIKEESDPSGEQHLIAERIERSSRRMFELINHFLEQNSERPEVTESNTLVSLHTMLEEIVEETRPQAAAKNQTLETGIEPVMLHTDIHAVQEILRNLISNAVKFTPKGGLVRVTLTSANLMAVFKVEDSGPGISPEELPVIFNRKHNGAAKPTGNESSTGLGLAISKELALLIGGELLAGNRKDQPGACFELLLKDRQQNRASQYPS